MPDPVFIDTVIAAEQLGVSPEVVLDWIAQGKLRTFGGKQSNPFIRRVEVLAVARELGVEPPAAQPKRVKSATARVQTRLTADSRWAEVSDEDIREWARRADVTRIAAARQVVISARQRLEMVLRALEDAEKET